MEEYKSDTKRQDKRETKKKHGKYPYTSKHIRYAEYIHEVIKAKNIKVKSESD